MVVKAEVAMRSEADRMVEIADRCGAEALACWLRSQPVQQLMTGKVDVVDLKRVKSYLGRAALSGPSRDRRAIRLNADPELEDAERVVLLCHELAHHVAGLRAHHGPRWREEWMALAERAFALGLIAADQMDWVRCLTRWGPATRFRGHPRRAERLKAQREHQGLLGRMRLEEMRVRPGVQVISHYRRQTWRGEVIRINRYTVSIGQPGKRHVIARVPHHKVFRLASES